MREPIVVIVSGAPGSGKTTLAGEIGAHLGWPLFCRDTFKEAIMDAIPVDTLEMSYSNRSRILCSAFHDR